MRAQRGEYGLELVSVIFVCIPGEIARARMSTGLIWRNREHALANSEGIQGLEDQFPELGWVEFCSAATDAEIETHEWTLSACWFCHLPVYAQTLWSDH